MKIIGLTGHIATGKSTVLKIFSNLGYPTISCDEIYHTLLKKNKNIKKKLIKIFGKKILWKNKISLKKLYKILVKNPKNLSRLERVTHPIILKKVFQLVKNYKKNYKHKICVVDVPLLFEKKLQNKFDYIIIVYCSEKTQKERLKKRKIDKKLLKILLSRQMSIKKKKLLSDFVIYNDNVSIGELKKQVYKILTTIDKLMYK